MQIYRLYVNYPFKSGEQITLAKEDSNYLLNVLRMKNGQPLSVFNDQGGEFQAMIINIQHKQAIIEIKGQIRLPEMRGTTELIFAPIKHDNMHIMIEKATELGVDILTPVITERTIIRTFNFDKYQKIAIQAAEQCGRVTIPIFHPQIQFIDFIEGFKNSDEQLLFAYERSEQDMKSLINANKMIIGPEGGFTEAEVKLLKNLPNVHEISLGKNILRAETAAISGLTLMNIINAN